MIQLKDEEYTKLVAFALAYDMARPNFTESDEIESAAMWKALMQPLDIDQSVRTWQRAIDLKEELIRARKRK